MRPDEKSGNTLNFAKATKFFELGSITGMADMAANCGSWLLVRSSLKTLWFTLYLKKSGG